MLKGVGRKTLHFFIHYGFQDLGFWVRGQG